jgi:amidase
VVAANPAVKAIVSLRDPDALAAKAWALDDRTPKGLPQGIPFAVRDLIAATGLRTTLGSPLCKDLVPPRDNHVAARLRDAGGKRAPI